LISSKRTEDKLPNHLIYLRRHSYQLIKVWLQLFQNLLNNQLMVLL